MRWRFLNIATIAINLSLAGLAGFFYFSGKTASSEALSRSDYLDASLAALNCMVAMLAIIIAIAALWGYSALREAAMNRAAEVADQVAREVAQRYALGDDEAQTVALFAAFLRQQKEHNKNKTKAGRARRPLQRPTSSDREGDNV